MPTAVEKVPTFSYYVWDGSNFDEFKEVFPGVTEFSKVLVIPVWDAKEKRWQDHKVFVSNVVVVNDLTDQIEVVNNVSFDKRFDPVV